MYFSRQCLVAIALVFAAATAIAADDPAVGTWTLNASKSKFIKGPAVKSGTRTYEKTPEGHTAVVVDVGADGKEQKATYTLVEDGKPHKIDDPDIDTVLVTKVDANDTHILQTKNGKTVSDSHRTISKDGKTLTYTNKATYADGTQIDYVKVYDRQ